MVCYRRRGRCFATPGRGGPYQCDVPDFPGQDGFYQAGCKIDPRFVLDPDRSTWTDHCTGLMWHVTRDINGNHRPPRDWQDVLEEADNIWCGYSGWRVPNIKELLSIVEYGQSPGVVDPVLGVRPDWHWSSTTWTEDITRTFDRAWMVHLGTAEVTFDYKSSDHYMILVRDAW